MKKFTQELTTPLLKKLKERKEQLTKLDFSTFKEDFVITEQEEKEGGFFSTRKFKMTPAFK